MLYITDGFDDLAVEDEKLAFVPVFIPVAAKPLGRQGILAVWHSGTTLGRSAYHKIKTNITYSCA